LLNLGRRQAIAPREWLLIANGLFPLAVFSVPGVTVYDGERLFSFVFPLWAVLIGRGAENARAWLSARWSPRVVAAVLGLFFSGQAYGLVALAPCWLSYYNLAVGGVPGAARLGLEVSYWGDGVTRTLLAEVAKRVPAGEEVATLPELYAGQWNEVWRQAPRLRDRERRPVSFDGRPVRQHGSRYVLMFLRPEYLPDEFRHRLDERQVIAAVRRQGVPLAVLLDRSSE
jgi:hypothetical protein